MAQQYIGSRISLISKSDIRYRGILHSIDPAASTVSLEQVRSMGTEGRKTNPAEEIAPTDTLYEFIVFRAADVKDLSIEAPAEPKPEPPKPSVPDDPAIMSTTAPPRHQAQTGGHNSFVQPPPMMPPPQGMYNNSMPPMMYPPGSVPPQWPPYGFVPPGQMHPMMGFPQQGPPPPPALGTAQPSTSPAVSASIQPPSKPTLAPVSGISGKLPPPNSTIALGGSPVRQKSAVPLTGASSAPKPPVAATNLVSTKASSNSSPTSAKSIQPNPVNKTLVPSVGINSTSAKSVFGPPTAMDMMTSIVGMNPVDTAKITSIPQTSNASGPNPKPIAPSGSSSPAKNSANTKTNGKHPTTNGAGPSPSVTSGPSQAPPMRHPLPQAPPKPKPAPSKTPQPISQTPNPIVPTQDFDFASANAKFNKTAINHKTNAETAVKGKSNSNGEDKKEGDGGGELLQGVESMKLGQAKDGGDELFIPEAPPGTYYDKKKSFFDDISSEVKERAVISQENVARGGAHLSGAPRGGGGRGGGNRGRGGKGWDRNAERQKNLDTFGEVALNPNLGALGSGYNGYGRGGAQRGSQTMNGYRGNHTRGRGGYHRGMGGFRVNPSNPNVPQSH